MTSHPDKLPSCARQISAREAKETEGGGNRPPALGDKSEGKIKILPVQDAGKEEQIGAEVKLSYLKLLADTDEVRVGQLVGPLVELTVGRQSAAMSMEKKEKLQEHGRFLEPRLSMAMTFPWLSLLTGILSKKRDLEGPSPLVPDHPGRVCLGFQARRSPQARCRFADVGHLFAPFSGAPAPPQRQGFFERHSHRCNPTVGRWGECWVKGMLKSLRSKNQNQSWETPCGSAHKGTWPRAGRRGPLDTRAFSISLAERERPSTMA